MLININTGYEEGGSYPNLESAWVVADALIRINGERHGNRMVWGTGGSEGRYIQGIANIFNNPVNYDVLPYRHNNTIDGGFVETGFFIPAWTTVMSTMDKRGVVDEIAARAYHQRARDKSSPSVLAKVCAEQCFTVEESLSLGGDNFFNAEKLADQYLRVVIHKDESCPKVKRGNLFWTYDSEGEKSGVRFEPSQSGKIEIIEEPIKKQDGQDVRNLYVSGIDSVDKGQEDSVTADGSKFCIVVKKRTFGNSGDVYVAKYMDRPQRINEAYDNALKLLIWYNCRANLEDTKTMVKEYFRKNKYVHLLMERPKAALSNMAKKRTNTKYVGTQASEKMVRYGLNLVSEYVEDFSHRIYFPEMIDQLRNYQYEKKTKFDLVAAMQMCEIADEDMFDAEAKVVKPNTVKDWKGVGYYIDDDGCKRFGIIRNGR